MRRSSTSDHAVTAYVALGSNLDDPVAQVARGLRALGALPKTRLVRASSFYRNPPEARTDQPDFVNAVAMVETGLAARELLRRLLDVERQHGRTRGARNAPRTLDLDLALYGGLTISEDGLIVPHPRLCERAFVLVPLAEIAPDADIPGRGRAGALAARLDASRLVRVT